MTEKMMGCREEGWKIVEESLGEEKQGLGEERQGRVRGEMDPEIRSLLRSYVLHADNRFQI